MKKNLRIVSILLLISTLLSLHFSVFAVDVNAGEISPRWETKPTTCWDWSEGTYELDGSSQGADLYSVYKFTGASKLRITIYNDLTNRELKVKLLKDMLGVDFSVSTKTIQAGGHLTWDVEVSSDREYYFKFDGPCSLHGTVQRIS